MSPAAAYKVQDLPGRGRGLMAARDLQPGEEVLSDAPLLLTPSLEARTAICATCMRILGAHHGQCSTCGQAAFCSPACAAEGRARPDIHSEYICRVLAAAGRLRLSSEEHSALSFLTQVSALRLAAASDAGAQTRLQALTSLVANMAADIAAPDTTAAAYAALSAVLGGPPPISADDAGRLLALEQCNAYGIMAPGGNEDERQVRGGGIYPTASLLNHECLPNVARFDNFDGALSAPDNTVVHFRTLHAVPAGEELTQSYFPITWDIEERQSACRTQYGFTCSCPRCQLETELDDGGSGLDEDEGAMSDGSEGSGSDGGEDQVIAVPRDMHSGALGEQPEAAGCTEDYIQLFIMKYVCPREQCHGTLAPTLGTDRSICNLCGLLRTDAEFLAEMQGCS